MKTYVLNLVVNTKNTDIYDKVALNKYPMVIICKSESELKEFLATEDTAEFVKSLIKSQRVYDTAEWKIRDIYPNGEVRELTLDVSELLNVEY